ncbi:RDD family protein [Xanthomonas albilineans]|uniref:Putative rdd-family protein n=2 Tax=Xanthomonas albilineans TaxID=29447 RepID=D2UFC7_XANAP|nr:RDD family protein [Xanthomonas albilineans]QHQ29333.1 putative rdd-family protein [Xanthomonas albilineans]CBA17088.1 putative rdd-family protein [Xanthomonas albilineans GPE PC73]
MSEWYYADASQQQHGPMSATDLQQSFQRGEIGLSTMVWRDDLSAWRKLSECVEELGLKEAPPATPGADQAPAAALAASEPAMAQSRCATPSAVLNSDSHLVTVDEVVQAGFWKRVAAHLIDNLLISIVASCITHSIWAPLEHGELLDSCPSGEASVIEIILIFPVIGCLLGLVQIAIAWGLCLIFSWPLLGAIYFGICHRFTRQATLGKMAVGIKVVRSDGSYITFARSIGRYFGFLLSSMTIGIGFLIAAFTRRKQALHDMLCDTLVVDKWAYTDHPERQRHNLGAVIIVILALIGILIVVMPLLMMML